jgi:hypothetical protein
LTSGRNTLVTGQAITISSSQFAAGGHDTTLKDSPRQRSESSRTQKA